MNSFAIASKDRTFWIIFACLASVFLHIALLTSTRYFTLSYHFGTHPDKFIEHRWTHSSTHEEIKAKKAEVIKRTQELSMIFQALTPVETEQPDSLVVESESQEILLEQPSVDFFNELSLAQSELIMEEIKGTDTGLFPYSENATRSPEIVHLDADSFKTTHQVFAEELLQATKPMHGAIVSEIAEPLLSLDSLTIGGLETTPHQGNSFKEREGLIERGFTNLDVEFRHQLMSASEMKMLKEELLKNVNTSENLFSSLYSLSLAPRSSHGYMPQIKNSELLTSCFDCKVEYAPKRDLTGYLFKVQWTPKPGNTFKRIPQNYFFLVDRSRSIGSKRYDLTKQAVIKALDTLKEEDTFNILVFDDKVNNFSDDGVPCTKENIQEAKKFLLAQKFANAFTSTDLSSSLGQILPMKAEENKVNTAILLSDGDTFLSRSKQRRTIANWTSENQGKVALFSLPVGSSNNLPLLELLSTFNRGLLFHAATEQLIDETLLMMLYAIQNPIGREMVATVTLAEQSGTCVKLFPSSKRLLNLYEQVPYTLYGSISNLEGFHLFLQSKDLGHQVSMGESISFENAKLVHNQELEQAFAIQQAYDLYAQFLRDGRRQHLQSIKQLLAPYPISMAFK